MLPPPPPPTPHSLSLSISPKSVMGLHLVALAAVQFSKGGATTTQMVSNLVWPYLIRVCLSLKIAHQDVLSSSRLFLFQLTQIIMVNLDHHHRDHHRIQLDNRTANTRNRWHRALRLVRERVDQVREVIMGPLPYDQDEDSLHILSMLAL